VNRTRSGPQVVAQVLRTGRAVLREGGLEHAIGPGDLFLFAFGEDTYYGRPPDRPEWPGHDEALVTDHVTIGGAGLREHWDLLRARHGSIVHLPERSPFYAAMREAAEPGPGPERVAALVMALAQAVEDAAGAGRSPVAQAIDAILADPCAEHNLKAIAERCGCSREHLSRVFQQQIGTPPAQWMRQRRVERAVVLLRDTDLPLAAVAARCGAGGLHRLARWTHELRRLPPLRLRRRLREELHRQPRPAPVHAPPDSACIGDL
jgi:AraC-like DNA-binding protein